MNRLDQYPLVDDVIDIGGREKILDDHDHVAPKDQIGRWIRRIDANIRPIQNEWKVRAQREVPEGHQRDSGNCLITIRSRQAVVLPLVSVTD